MHSFILSIKEPSESLPIFPADIEMKEEETDPEYSGSGKRERLASSTSSLSEDELPPFIRLIPAPAKVSKVDQLVTDAVEEFTTGARRKVDGKMDVGDNHWVQMILDEVMDEMHQMFVTQRVNWGKDLQQQTTELQQILTQMKVVTSDVMSASMLKVVHSWKPAVRYEESSDKKLKEMAERQLKMESSIESMENVMETLVTSMARVLDMGSSLESLSHLQTWRPAVNSNELSNDLEAAIYRLSDRINQRESMFTELPAIKSELVEAVNNLKLLADQAVLDESDRSSQIDHCIVKLNELTIKREVDGDGSIDYRTAAEIQTSLDSLNKAVASLNSDSLTEKFATSDNIVKTRDAAESAAINAASALTTSSSANAELSLIRNSVTTANSDAMEIKAEYKAALNTILKTMSGVQADVKQTTAMTQVLTRLIKEAKANNDSTDSALVPRLEELQSVAIDINANLSTMSNHVKDLNHLKSTLEGRAAAGLANHPRSHPAFQSKFEVRPDSRDFRLLSSDSGIAAWFRMSEPTTPAGLGRVVNSFQMLWHFMLSDARNKSATIKLMRKPDSSQAVKLYLGIDNAMNGWLRGGQGLSPWPAEFHHPTAAQAAERAGNKYLSAVFTVHSVIPDLAEHAARKAEAREIKEAERRNQEPKTREDFAPLARTSYSPWMTPGSNITGRIGASATFSNTNVLPVYNSFGPLQDCSASPTYNLRRNSGSLFDGDGAN